MVFDKYTQYPLITEIIMHLLIIEDTFLKYTNRTKERTKFNNTTLESVQIRVFSLSVILVMVGTCM